MKPCAVIFAFIVALALHSPARASQAQPVSARVEAATPDRLVGLWKARRWFGPEVRGVLLVRRIDGRLAAEIAGRRVPVREQAGALSFELPGGEGRFRGVLERSGTLMGRWEQPRTVASGPAVTPIRFERQGPGQWRGEVRPLEDTLTLFMLVGKRPDGSLGVVLRNPERDLGAQLRADRLVARENRVELLGGRSLDRNEVLAAGSYDADRDVVTLTLRNRGGAYDFERAGSSSGFYPRGAAPQPYAYIAPAALDDGWRTGTLESAGLDRPAIERLVNIMLQEPMDLPASRQIHALLVARDGRLVLEEYFHGTDPAALHTTRSAGKSITSVLVGAALRSDRRLELTTPVYSAMNGGSFPRGLGSRKRAMTLEHLLTMSSGYFCDDSDDAAPGNEEIMTNQEEEPDYHRFTLGVPMAYDPGQVGVYCSANPNLALGVVERVTGEDPLLAFDRLVARPMQIDRYAWLVDGAGHAYGGGSVFVTPRDFLKFGQLMLDGGVWRGRRVLSEDYVRRATSPLQQVRNLGYGYLWWTTQFPYRDRTITGYMALGAGGQSILVLPELRLVVAIMAGQFSSPGTHDIQNIPVRSILPAVDHLERRDGPVRIVEYNSPYGRGVIPPPRITPD